MLPCSYKMVKSNKAIILIGNRDAIDVAQSSAAIVVDAWVDVHNNFVDDVASMYERVGDGTTEGHVRRREGYLIYENF